MLDHGGRLYAAKDALMRPGAFVQMFLNPDKFLDVLAKIDPEARFQWDMSRRLKFTRALLCTEC